MEILDRAWEPITPQMVKLAAAGDKNATKVQVDAGVVEEFPNAIDFLSEFGEPGGPRREHVADALGCILVGWRTPLYRALSR